MGKRGIGADTASTDFAAEVTDQWTLYPRLSIAGGKRHKLFYRVAHEPLIDRDLAVNGRLVAGMMLAVWQVGVAGGGWQFAHLVNHAELLQAQQGNAPAGNLFFGEGDDGFAEDIRHDL